METIVGSLVGDMTSISVKSQQLERQAVRGHAELSVLQGALSRHDTRLTNMEQWGVHLADSFNSVEDRVTTLEHWGDELAESLGP